MKTPKPVSSAEAAAAIDRIVERRRTINDPHLDEFIAAGHDAREVRHAAMKYRRGLADWVAEADVHDALILVVRAWWDWSEDDLAWLARAEQLGMNRKTVGHLLNLGSGQAIPDRIRARRRQMAQVRGEPDPAERDDEATEQARTDAQQQWIRRHHDKLDEARDDILAHKDCADDEAYESLVDVANEPWTPATVTLMTYAVFEINQSSNVADLPDEHPLHMALDRWGTLIAEYQQIADATTS